MPHQSFDPEDQVLDPTLMPYAASIAESKKSVIAFKYIAQMLDSYSAGEKLPSEREIADVLGMTRSPVHEAMVALKIAGRIRIEPGVGAFSLSIGEGAEKDSALLLLAQSESPHEVSQLRIVVEEVILRTLIPDLTADRMEQIERAFRNLSEALSHGGVEAYIEANREFHMTLATATGNSLLARLEHWMLYEMMTQRLWREVLETQLKEISENMEDVVQTLIHEHQEILAAVRARDTELAVALMLRHVGRIEPESDE